MHSKTSSCSARPKWRTLPSNRASAAALPLARLPQHPPQASGTSTRAVTPMLPLFVAWRGPESNQSPAADPWMWTVVDRSHRSWHRSAWPNLRRDPGSSLALLQHPMLNRKCHYALVTLFRGTIMVSLGVGRAAGVEGKGGLQAPPPKKRIEILTRMPRHLQRWSMALCYPIRSTKLMRLTLRERTNMGT
eukprot:SAG31_NODE_1723_length_7441_cov_12.555026_8_plen_190_part_00